MLVSKGRALPVNRSFNIRAITLIIVIAVLQLFFVAQSKIAHANQFSWSGTENPTVVSSVTSPVEPYDCPLSQTMNVMGEASPKRICLSSDSGMRFGTYSEGGSSHIPVINTIYDNNMYKLRGICGGYKDCLYLADKDILVTKQHLINGFVKSLVIYKNFSSRLTMTINDSTFAREYTFNSANPDYVFRNADNYAWPIGGIGASDNEEWLVFEARERAVMMLNTDTFEIKRLSVQQVRYGVGSDPLMEFDITNDGQHVVMMGRSAPNLIFDVSDTCGDKPTDEQLQENKPIPKPCPYKSLHDFGDDFIERFKEGLAPKFDFGGGELTFYATSYSVDTKLVTLRANGYVGFQLDYLALGDSISSGEGDTELTSDGKKYYLAWTDLDGDYGNNIPREKCHQSLRAWPFLLADSLGNDEVKNETVACSGATIGDIASSKAKYEGQYNGGNPNKPRLQGLSNIEMLQNTALNDFIPGRERQIEFVKKYKPKAITLGISGNDVDFVDIIKSCTFGTISSTCSYADGKQETANLGKQIAAQYNSLTTLYKKLHKASSETKIYSVGYPKFVSMGMNCGLNVQLDENEREMAERAIEYLNAVIEKASQNVGVEYINIENSLNGKRLCDDIDNPYVTGLAAWMKNENQESFHPNKNGNKLIADAITTSLKPDNLLTHRNCPPDFIVDFCPDSSVSAPEPHAYFADAMNNHDRSVKNEQLTNDTANKTTTSHIKTAPFSLKPGSAATIELHSEPVDLGSYIVKQEGNLSEDILIPPDVPAGYHTLHVHGNSYSSELIDLTQIIEVQGPENDIDEDGIQDTSDQCLYVTAAEVDADFDNIDDACDPQINVIQPYRVRNGDVAHGENENYIYVERNINASSVTGIIGDYDPNNDGWAIVAASHNKKTSGVPANFWIDENKVPHVSIRTSDKSCVQFTPQSLTQVVPDKKRKLKQEAKNTNTCLSEPTAT